LLPTEEADFRQVCRRRVIPKINVSGKKWQQNPIFPGSLPSNVAKRLVFVNYFCKKPDFM
jgi:hypothetical protein